MDMLSEYLSNKMEHITSSSLYSQILLWTDKLHSKQQQRNTNGYCYCYYGLQTLVHFHSEEKKPPRTRRILHCYNMAATATATVTAATSKPYSLLSQRLSKSLWLSSSPALKSTVMGDVIGTESGDCMICDVAEEEQVEAAKVKGQSQSESRRGVRERSGRRRTREFPLPITLLRQTGRMPWTFKREYSEDGRLVITAERVKRHEYVEAYREHGMLNMKLVHHDDDDDDESVCCEECGWPIDEEEEELVDEEESGFEFEFEQELATKGRDGCCGELSQKSSLENESGRCGDLRQCVSYAGSGDGLVRESDSFWIGEANSYLGRPGSAPLQPMTPVM